MIKWIRTSRLSITNSLSRLVLGLLLDTLAHPDDPGVAPQRSMSLTAAPGDNSRLPGSGSEDAGAAGGGMLGEGAPASTQGTPTQSHIHPRRPASPRTLGALGGSGRPFTRPGAAGGGGGGVGALTAQEGAGAQGTPTQKEEMGATLLRIASSMDTLTALTLQMAEREPPYGGGVSYERGPAYLPPATPWSLGPRADAAAAGSRDTYPEGAGAGRGAWGGGGAGERPRWSPLQQVLGELSDVKGLFAHDGPGYEAQGDAPGGSAATPPLRSVRHAGGHAQGAEASSGSSGIEVPRFFFITLKPRVEWYKRL